MYEQWHMIAAYVIGTAVGVFLFRQYVQERIITATIDTLIRDEYVRSYEDEEGITHLYKWHDIEDILEQIKEQNQEYYDEDDTP